MSTLYLSPDPHRLADKVADNLDEHAGTGDFFAPTAIVVPNRFQRKWLRLYLARRHGFAVNLSFLPLEDALWQLLRELDPAAQATPPEPLDDNTYRLLVLSVLLNEMDSDLIPLRQYLQMEKGSLSRLTCRRAWYLADRLGMMIRDYEYDRQDVLIQPWLKGEFGVENATEFQKMMERAQQALFTHITREPAGKRALLNRLGEKSFKTFPQYAMERMTASADGVRASALRTIHFFGLTHVCELHARTIAWLAQFFDVRWYHPNVIVSRLEGEPTPAALMELAHALRTPSDAELVDPGRELLRLWGIAGVESLELLKSWPFAMESLGEPSPARSQSQTVLGRLQRQLRGAVPSNARLDQDTSLQIVACPGIAREVETVYDSIVHNLNVNRSLRQTDIAVLVTDMQKYRAALHAVFERPPRRLQYNLVDFRAAEASSFGQAVLGMLDLALETFSRSRVFGVLLNPCFLARLAVDRGQATTWLAWAENLGIYQGWDAEEKKQQGYAPSPLYSWKLGLQRLRLGRFMDVAADDDDGPACRFGDVIPFADLESGEREHLDAFCRAVEGLLPTLADLRSKSMPGARWAHTLAHLVQEFLDVPDDRPEEAQVRDALLSAFEKLPRWDVLHDAGQKSSGLPLALVREYVRSQLEGLEGNRGDFLVGGVTIAALAPMRPMPFAVVYVLGLGEDSFPGSNALSSLDLRGAARLSGDVRPAEQRLYDFLNAVASAHQKLYLFYNNRDLQKDQALLPSQPLQQLQRFLSQHVVTDEFQPTEMPAHADDARYLDSSKQPAHQDVLVQTRDADRCLAIDAAIQDGRLTLDKTQGKDFQARRDAFKVDFSIPHSAPTDVHARSANTVSLHELKRFLQLPAQASLRRHLYVEEDEEITLNDDEPLVSPRRAESGLVRQTLQKLIQSTADGGLEQALAAWKGHFQSAYADARLRCLVPDDAFGAIDQKSIIADLQERIHGQGALETFLRERAGMTFCGPILIGESLTPIGARLQFPALTLRPGHELPADVETETRIVGFTSFAWHAPGRLDILVVSSFSDIDGREIHPTLVDPALFHLGLLANAQPNGDGIASDRWLAQREVALHAAHRGGIQTWIHPPGSITAAEALAFFVHLARDFLDPAQFDLLPLDVLCKKENAELRNAMHDDGAANIAPDAYLELLHDAITEVRENPYGFIQIPPLVEMVNARIPDDALAKVQRRFRLLDRGPARVRRQRSVVTRKKQ
jgi:exonuclease V gamma subunit